MSPKGTRYCVVLVWLFGLGALSWAQDRPETLASAPQEAPQDAALRALVEQYFAAYAKKDLNGMMALWSPAATELDARQQQARDFFTSTGNITLTHLELERALVEGEKARLLVTFDLSATEAKTGGTRADLGKMTRSLECAKEAGLWRIARDVDAADDLADLLVTAKSEQERAALLDRDKLLVNPAVVKSLVRLATERTKRGEYDEALSAYQTANRLATTISDQAGIASIWRGVGYVQMVTGKFVEALETYGKSLAIAEALDDKPAAGQVLIFMSATHSSLGNFPLALEESQKGLEIFESIGDKRNIANAFLAVGRCYSVENKYTQALEYLFKGLAEAEELKDLTLIDNIVGNIGFAYEGRGDHARALEYYQRGLVISRTLKALPVEAKHLTNIGNVYWEQNDFAEALSYYQQSLELARKVGDKFTIAWITYKLGETDGFTGDYDKALELGREALALFEEMGNKPDAATVLDFLGTLSYSRKDFVQAFAYFDRSLRLSQEIGRQETIAGALVSLANAHYKQKGFAEALELADRAYGVAREIDHRPTLWRSRVIAGYAYQALHKPLEARSAFDEAIRVVESLREGIAGGEEQQQSFFADKLDPYHGMVELLVGESQFPAALSYAERAKGRSLAEVLSNGRVNITKAMTAAERQSEEELQSQLVSLNRQLGAERGASTPDQRRLADLKSSLEKTRLQYSDFRTNLYVAHPELRAQRGQIQPISLSDAASLLPDNHSAILEFLVAEQKAYLFVVTRGTGGNAARPELTVHTIAINAKDLDRETEQFRRQLSLRDLQFRPSALRLYKLLVEPVQSQLSRVTTLLIVPDGPLWNLPFQALRPREGHYLLENYALSYAPSLTILREMARLRLRNKDLPAIKAGQTLLAMGNPVLAATTSERAKLTYRDEKLAPLPEAAREVKTLESLYGRQRSKVFVGASAAEGRFKAQAGEFKILHLATHGLLNDTNPMYSHLLLSSDGPSGKEDGLLEAWEIMDLDLHADLAVLSACETARGRITSGEGVIGLTWAFFVAGVPTTVVSQWKVESISTTELMLAFHRARKVADEQGRSPFRTAQALQRAELQLLRNPRYSHPFYWAGFVVVGDPH